jgi:hypothetical protein
MRVRNLLLSTTALLALGVSSHAANAPTFNKDVLPILQRNCQSCHRPGQVAPMSLLDYEHVRPWAKAIKSKVVARQMPPWNADPAIGKFSNDSSLKQAEIDTIAAWVDQGAVEGDAKDKPAPVVWPDGGWMVKPDHIVKGPETKVPAKTKNSVIEWSRVAVPSGLDRDTWITSIEVRPSEPSVTHHICVHFMPHNSDVEYGKYYWNEVMRDDRGVEIPRKKGETMQQNLEAKPALRDASEGEACYLPGLQSVMDYRGKGAGKLIPAGTDIVFSLHYTPNGKEVIDRPQVAFTFAKQPPARRYVSLTVRGPQDAVNFAIPPGEANWRAPQGTAVLEKDAEIVWLSPHMHLRGKDMLFELVTPDGKKTALLNVPRYDFNWQLGYELAQPVKAPKGSKIILTSHFDNSVNNKYNPDPQATVYYGGMVWEEMNSGFVGLLVDRDVKATQVFARGDAAAEAHGE